MIFCFLVVVALVVVVAAVVPPVDVVNSVAVLIVSFVVSFGCWFCC